mgnify:CR=1 FL=1
MENPQRDLVILDNFRLPLMLTIHDRLSNLNNILTRSLTVSLLAAVAILLGFVPEFSRRSPSLIISFSAEAQDFSDQDVMNYARAVLQMESHRQQAYEQIKKIIGQAPPAIVCNQPNSYSNLPGEAQKIARDYCSTSKQIVEESGLSVSQFNAITTRAQSDNNLEKRVQNAMIQIRKR